jgi:hypothetical protein
MHVPRRPIMEGRDFTLLREVRLSFAFILPTRVGATNKRGPTLSSFRKGRCQG